MKNKNMNYMGVGICLGVLLGSAFHNIPIGICIGIAIGAGLDSKKSKKSNG